MPPVPKPTPKAKKPPKPLTAKHWGVSQKPGKPLQTINRKQTTRREAKRRKDRRAPAETIAREEGWIRANGRCECGLCGGLPFDKSDGQFSDDYPEWHHDNYRKRVGRWLRRWCHTYIETHQYSWRHTKR